MIKATRLKATRRSFWARFGVGAGALLLPPMALGAAVYSMLPLREDGAGRPVAGPVAPAPAAVPKFRSATAQAWPVDTDFQPPAAPSQPFATAGEPAPAANTRTLDAPDGGKGMARGLGPIPVRVTVVVPPAGVKPAPAANADSAPTGSVGAAPARSAAAQAPDAPPPPLVAQPIPFPPRQLSAPQMPPRQVPNAQVPVAQVHVPPAQVTQLSAARTPATEPQSAEEPHETSHVSGARKHVRLSYLRTLAARNGARAEARREARSETRAARESPQPQQAFSLGNWFQQLGAPVRNTGGRD